MPLYVLILTAYALGGAITWAIVVLIHPAPDTTRCFALAVVWPLVAVAFTLAGVLAVPWLLVRAVERLLRRHT